MVSTCTSRAGVLLLFVFNKPFDLDWDVRPHGLLKAGHMAEELLFSLLWWWASPVADKHNRAWINDSFADPLTTKATLVCVFQFCHNSVLTHKLTCRGRCNDIVPRETGMRPRSSSAVC